MITIINEIETVIDFAWELSRDDSSASYPRKRTIVDVKTDIQKAISKECSNVIACYSGDVLCGLCVYFWKENDKYAQTTQFLIGKNYNETADELIEYISNQLKGYELYIGVPSTNKNAIKYFSEKEIVCISSIDTRMYNLEKPIDYKNDCIEEINRSNFDEYTIFHDKFAVPLEMYYNSKNLQAEIDRFRVIVYKEQGRIHGSIFTQIGENMSEVFGMFVDEGYENKNVESILINKTLITLYNEFGSVDEIIYFIDEDSTNELKSALDAGFKIMDMYKCYKYIL